MDDRDEPAVSAQGSQDHLWLARARFRLDGAGVPAAERDALLREVCGQVSATGEGAEGLYGDANSWAEDQVAELAERRVPFRGGPRGAWRRYQRQRTRALLSRAK